MSILDVDTKSIDQMVGSVTDSLGSVAETLGSTVSTVTETVTETITDDVLPAARSGATRTIRIIRTHPRVSLGIAAAAVLLVLAMWMRRRPGQTAGYDDVAADGTPIKGSKLKGARSAA